MLGESIGHHNEPHIDNLENNKPLIPTSNNGANLNITRQVLKKGGKKLRSTPSSLQRPPHHNQPQLHQKPPRMRLADHNNNKAATLSTKSTLHPNTEVSSSTHTVFTLLLKQGSKKELLKPKSGRFERGPTQQGVLSVHSLSKHDQVGQNLNTRSHMSKHSNAPSIPRFVKKQDNGNQQKLLVPSLLQPPHREEKRPFSSVDNVKIVHVSPAEAVPEELKDAEKIYAGAKFSEPPSPSVLPKPPSHWVGEDAPQHSNHSREQMTVHLKSLLKVQDKL